jgi:hypothetical protein
MGVGGFSPGIKRPGCVAAHSLLSSAEVKNGEAIPHTRIDIIAGDKHFQLFDIGHEGLEEIQQKAKRGTP